VKDTKEINPLWEFLVRNLADEDCVGLIIATVKREGKGLSTDINEFTPDSATENETFFVNTLADLFYESQQDAIRKFDASPQDQSKGDVTWN